MKNIHILLLVIIILVVTNIITFCEVKKMSEIASYHMQETEEMYNVLEGILDRVEKDRSDYFWNVLIESQEYMEYEELKY